MVSSGESCWSSFFVALTNIHQELSWGTAP
uniref:Uncharacterized protein n=1 Tax=Anguilla anguilla TaxID=7936 RepID=A0A0E9TGU2_ANGAN